jgi:hypothetical protein
MLNLAVHTVTTGFKMFHYTTNKDASEAAQNKQHKSRGPTIRYRHHNDETLLEALPALWQALLAILAPCIKFRTTDKAKGPVVRQITVALRLCLFSAVFISPPKYTK